VVVVVLLDRCRGRERCCARGGMGGLLLDWVAIWIDDVLGCASVEYGIRGAWFNM